MDDDDDPYESLPPEAPFYHHMMAGAIAGIAEHCLMYPVDVVKTRMMCIKANPETNYKSIKDALGKIVTKEGYMRPFRGVQAVFCGAGPAHAMYFAGYEKLKKDFTNKYTKGRPGEAPVANAAAGGIATLLHDAVMNPAEVVKQRMQMFQSPYKNCRDCLKQVFRTEGASAFYRSYATALTMNIPFQVAHFVIYEKMQELTNHERTYNPTTHMLSGAVAGGVAAAVTTPLDVCRTLLNTQQGTCAVQHCAESPLTNSALNNTRPVQISGMFQAVRLVYVTRGFNGFFRGWKPRVIYQMPGTAICWACYESFKHFLQPKGGESSSHSPPSGLNLPSVITFDNADAYERDASPLLPTSTGSSSPPGPFSEASRPTKTASSSTGATGLLCDRTFCVCAASSDGARRLLKENDSSSVKGFDAHSIMPTGCLAK